MQPKVFQPLPLRLLLKALSWVKRFMAHTRSSSTQELTREILCTLSGAVGRVVSVSTVKMRVEKCVKRFLLKLAARHLLPWLYETWLTKKSQRKS
jgi:hypothetical protein